MSPTSEFERIAALEAQLAEALKFLGHDAREGHSSTLALLELQRIKPDPMTLAQLAERVEANARRSLVAIDDFADLVRARSQALAREELDLLDLMVEVVADAWTGASQAGVRIQVAQHPPVIMGWADRELLTPALAKLLRDAVAKAPRGSHLMCALRLTPEGDCLFEFDFPAEEPLASKSANGSSGETAERAVRRATRPPAGLALAQAVAQRHGGSVTHAVAPGQRQLVSLRLAPPSPGLGEAPK